jgi:hypothetical protein
MFDVRCMSKSVVRLFSISSSGLGEVRFASETMERFGRRGDELRLLLSDVNGFYVFESALHVLPARSGTHYTDLERWNRPDVWKVSYGKDLEGILCFAEDVFGGQFCIFSDSIWYFKPESGEHTQFSSTLEEWAKSIIDDYDLRTGFSLAHQWQQLHGPLPIGQRLVPKQPFVLGGEFVPQNLVAYDAALGMRVRGELARQIRDLPDGSQFRYRLRM